MVTVLRASGGELCYVTWRSLNYSLLIYLNVRKAGASLEEDEKRTTTKTKAKKE
jgi:hypothetical protein